MKTYLTKTPSLIAKIYRNQTWRFSDVSKTIYLTFDDGPTPEITPWVISCLKEYNAKATFFCIGKNLKQQPAIHTQIVREGHCIGNHTFDHLNGWKSTNEDYYKSVSKTQALISNSNLFRPPYGRIKSSQTKFLITEGYQIIMWSILSGDFDKNQTPEQCATRVMSKSRNGDIIVFHDSVKAFENLKIALPKVLEYFSGLGYQFASIPA